MLRALGSTRAMIARSVIVEAMLLGVLGSLLGVLFGYGMAKGLVYLFGKAFLFEITTLDPLPLRPRLRHSRRHSGHGRRGPLPGHEGGEGKPRRGDARPVRRGTGETGGRASSRSSAPVFGLLLAGAGVPWIYYLAKNLSANLEGFVYASGIVAIIAAFLGISLVIPVLVRPLAALFSPALRLLFGVEGRMAAANATRNRGRTALTASALMVGISLVVAFSALGGSLLGSIRDYLDGSLGSDYVVQPTQQNSDARLLRESCPRRSVGYRASRRRRASSRPSARTGRRWTPSSGWTRIIPEIFRVNYAAGGSGRLLQAEGRRCPRLANSSPKTASSAWVRR